MTIKDLKKLISVREDKITLIKSFKNGETIEEYKTYDDFKVDTKYDDYELDNDGYVFYVGTSIYSIWTK